MNIFDNPHFDNHEQVCFFEDKQTGLKAIVAVHNTTLGPSAGGCRMWQYDNEQQALIDVLRLSKGMTYKSAVAGLALGGGKAVIIGNSKTDKSPALFKRFGQFIDNMSGSYIVAEDVGITPDDIAIVGQSTKHVAGTVELSGDPSPYTADGTFYGIQAACKHQFGTESLRDMKISVQGVGHVGYYLCQHLYHAGAKLFVTDIDQAALTRVEEEFSATVVGRDDIYDLEVDVYAPCALGGTINDNTLQRLKAKVIAGCANNQLLDSQHAKSLDELGILYAPDYVINAGGIINVASEVAVGGYNKRNVETKVKGIYDSLDQIFSRAKASNRTTADIADELAREILAKGKV